MKNNQDKNTCVEELQLAIQAYSQAIQLNPNDYQILYHRSQAYLFLGKFVVLNFLLCLRFSW